MAGVQRGVFALVGLFEFHSISLNRRYFRNVASSPGRAKIGPNLRAQYMALTVRRIRQLLPTSNLHKRVCEGILIGFFMIKMVRAARRTINLRCGSLAARPKLAFVFGFLATAIVVLASLSWFHRNQVDEARSAQ